ncbi:RNase MRP subunit [Metarhizium acridum]|uniref:RNase MRP subunit n=1 Tax=Metarhizium acridum TaxID=92637 RepID=UPI001C6B22E4|nr:RNase MRP subunit [Metarhizium acridum]
MAYRNQSSEPQQLRKPPSSAPADPERTQATNHPHASTTLNTILPLLDAFNHRHHNQHRTSHWWATFGILRRSLRALAECLDQPVVDSSRNRTDHAVVRASWLNTHVLPSAFLAFSQLTADNQHAPLGLFLLTVLSQVHGFLSGMLPQNAAPAKAKLPMQKSPNPPSPNHPSVIGTEHTDRGVVVSRETIIQTGDDAVDLQSKKRSRDEIKSHARATSNMDREKDKKPRKKKKKAGDELSSLFDSLS